MREIIIYTDGGARGNPGPAGAGAVIQTNGKVFELKKFLGQKQTNNWAEYEAVALALAEAKRLGFAGRSLEVRMDSKLVVEQISGNWKIKEPTLRPQVAKVHALLADFPEHRFVHIPREKNSEADRLVNEVIDEAL
jgi:ribonuclease HI